MIYSFFSRYFSLSFLAATLVCLCSLPSHGFPVFSLFSLMFFFPFLPHPIMFASPFLPSLTFYIFPDLPVGYIIFYLSCFATSFVFHFHSCIFRYSFYHPSISYLVFFFSFSHPIYFPSLLIFLRDFHPFPLSSSPSRGPHILCNFPHIPFKVFFPIFIIHSVPLPSLFRLFLHSLALIVSHYSFP